MDDVCLPVTQMITMEDPQSEYAAFERRQEHARLKEAVVEAAKAWHVAILDIDSHELPIGQHGRRQAAADAPLAIAIAALLEFEKDLAA